MEYIYSISEQLGALPWMVLCVLVCWNHLRCSKRIAAASCAVFAAWLVLCGSVCQMLGWPTNYTLIPSFITASALLVLICSFSHWKTIWLVASAAYLGAFVTYMAVIVDAYVVGNTISSEHLAWPGMAVQWGLSALSALLLWKPLRHKLPSFLAEMSYGKFWRFAWLLPGLSAVFLVIAMPIDTNNLLIGRLGYLIAVAFIAQLVLVGLSYWLAVRLIVQSAEHIRSIEENRQLSLALQQAAHQQELIDDARQARHDLRHHVHAIASLLDEGKSERARTYIMEIEGQLLPEDRMTYCENEIVGPIAAYYLGRARAAGAHIDTHLDIPKAMGIPDVDLAVIVGNILENAAQAIERDAGAEPQPNGIPFITAKAKLIHGKTLVFTCDNSCTTGPKTDTPGGFSSVSEVGSGIGISSVTAAAKRNGGTAQFTYKDGVFSSSVAVQCP